MIPPVGATALGDSVMAELRRTLSNFRRAITVIGDDRRHHPLRRGRGLLRPTECRVRTDVGVARQQSCRSLRRRDPSMGKRSTAGVERHRPAWRRAPDTRRRRLPWLQLARGGQRTDRRLVAKWLLPRHLPRPRRPCGSCGVPYRFRGHGGRAARPGLARDRHQHVQRLQQLGRLQPVHGRQASLVRPAVRARDADAAVDRARRPQVTTGVSRRGTRRRRTDLPAVPVCQWLSGVHGLGGLVHLRAPVRRVGRGRGCAVRLRRVE